MGILGGGVSRHRTKPKRDIYLNRPNYDGPALAVKGQATTPGVISTAPLPDIIYGPTLGAQAIRDGAGPRLVVDPGPGHDSAPYYYFTPATCPTATVINSAIATYPANSTFIFSAGTYNWGSTSPVRDAGVAASTNTPSKQPTLVFLPGAIIQGSSGYSLNTRNPLGPSRDPQRGGPANEVVFYDAFRGIVRGGHWRYWGSGPEIGSYGILEDLEVSWCWQNGIRLSGFYPTARYCYVHHNGVNGIVSGTAGPYPVRKPDGNSYGGYCWNPWSPTGTPWLPGTEVHHCEFAYNHVAYDARETAANTANNRGCIFFEGGMKFVWRENDWIHHNWYHDNQSYGIWWDVYNRGNPDEGRGKTIVEENVSEWNGAYTNMPAMPGSGLPNLIQIYCISVVGNGTTVTVETDHTMNGGVGHQFDVLGQAGVLGGTSVAGFNVSFTVTAILDKYRFQFANTTVGTSTNSPAGKLNYGGNGGDGIYYEISFGPAVFRHNFSVHNYGNQMSLRGVNAESQHDRWKFGGLIEIHNNQLYASHAGTQGNFGSSYGCGPGVNVDGEETDVCAAHPEFGVIVNKNTTGFVRDVHVYDNDITSYRTQGGTVASYRIQGNDDIPQGEYPSKEVAEAEWDQDARPQLNHSYYMLRYGYGPQSHDLTRYLDIGPQRDQNPTLPAYAVEKLNGRNIRFYRNHYHIRAEQGQYAFMLMGNTMMMPDGRRVFTNPFSSGGSKTWTEWQNFGFDGDGTYSNFTTFRADYNDPAYRNGEWNPAWNYIVGDACMHQGKTWTAIAPSGPTSGGASEPPSAKWRGD